MGKNDKKHVLDSSAFIHGFDDFPSVSIKGVKDELKGESVYKFEAMLGKGMEIISPKRKSIKKVRKEADISGDINDLSEVDLKLIAAAFELDGILVTDDYAMQNVAKSIGIEIATVRHEQIQSELVWKFKCVNCARIYDKKISCEVCGGETEKTPSSPS